MSSNLVRKYIYFFNLHILMSDSYIYCFYVKRDDIIIYIFYLFVIIFSIFIIIGKSRASKGSMWNNSLCNKLRKSNLMRYNALFLRSYRKSRHHSCGHMRKGMMILPAFSSISDDQVYMKIMQEETICQVLKLHTFPFLHQLVNCEQ